MPDLSALGGDVEGVMLRPKLLMWTGGSAAAVALGLVLWGTSPLWPSPDYARIGSCTTAEIDRTYAEIDKAGAFRTMSAERVNAEFWAFHPHVRTIRSAFERGINIFAYNTFGKRKTAAFHCNHANRQVLGVTMRTLPELAASLRLMEKDESARWRLALCMVGKARSLETTAYFDGLRNGCKSWPWKPNRH